MIVKNFKATIMMVVAFFVISCNNHNASTKPLDTIELYRIRTGTSTIGIMTAKPNRIICYTLENNRYIIKAGNYELIPRIHKKFGKCVQLGGKLLNRGFYLHCGNLIVNSRGCILVADSVINTQKIFRCRPALDSLYKIISEHKTFLNIIER